eukprot:COSAG04_NODE_729_length_10753_cov_2.112728_11_plen_193_part_00
MVRRPLWGRVKWRSSGTLRTSKARFGASFSKTPRPELACRQFHELEQPLCLRSAPAAGLCCCGPVLLRRHIVPCVALSGPAPAHSGLLKSSSGSAKTELACRQFHELEQPRTGGCGLTAAEPRYLDTDTGLTAAGQRPQGVGAARRARCGAAARIARGSGWRLGDRDEAAWDGKEMFCGHMPLSPHCGGGCR